MCMAECNIFMNALSKNIVQQNMLSLLLTFIYCFPVQLEYSVSYSLSDKLSPTHSQLIFWLTRTDRRICSSIMGSVKGGGQHAIG